MFDIAGFLLYGNKKPKTTFMAITSSLEQIKKSPFILSARQVRMAQQYPKGSFEWRRIHMSLTKRIMNHFLDRTPDALKECLSERYLSPLRSERHDQETNLEKFVEEIVLTILDPKAARPLHFMAPVVISHKILLCDLFEKEFRHYVTVETRDLPDKIIFDFGGTLLLQNQ